MRQRWYIYLQAPQPPLDESDSPVHKLNARVSRLVMLYDLNFFPGTTQLYPNEKWLTDAHIIDSRPRPDGSYGIVL